MDRNLNSIKRLLMSVVSLSARRAWIEITSTLPSIAGYLVALRKESVDRNYAANAVDQILPVALRKESVDRNARKIRLVAPDIVALRKESVDRNARPTKGTQGRYRRSPQGERG